jgi:hypothetical protein
MPEGLGGADRSAARRSWPIRLYRLGGGPGDDLSGVTTVAERLAMMWPLALEAWALTGQPLAAYPRREIPVSFRPWSDPA